MPVICQRESTNLIGRAVVTLPLILLICLHPVAKYTHKYAHKIPTDSRPLKSLAVGIGLCADRTTDKEGSQ